MNHRPNLNFKIDAQWFICTSECSNIFNYYNSKFLANKASKNLFQVYVCLKANEDEKFIVWSIITEVWGVNRLSSSAL